MFFFVHLVGTGMSFRYPLYHGKSLACPVAGSIDVQDEAHFPSWVGLVPKDHDEPIHQRQMMVINQYIVPSLKLTASLPLKMDGWNTTFLLGRPIFRGYVSFREGI